MIVSEQTPCPYCDHGLSHVIDVRRQTSTNGIVESRRRRVCLACHRRYTTIAQERVIGLYTRITTTYRVST